MVFKKHLSTAFIFQKINFMLRFEVAVKIAYFLIVRGFCSVNIRNSSIYFGKAKLNRVRYSLLPRRREVGKFQFSGTSWCGSAIQ